MFIVFEGMDCTGKSTQINVLKKFFETNFPGKEVILSKHPYDIKVRQILLEQRFNKSSELLLLVSDLIQNIKDHFISNDRNKIFIFDRYIYSTYVYQMSQYTEFGFNKIKDFIIENIKNLDIIKPDHIIYMNMDVDDIRIRLNNKDTNDDKIESKLLVDYDYATSISNAYKNLFINNLIPNSDEFTIWTKSSNIIIENAKDSIENISTDIIEKILMS